MAEIKKSGRPNVNTEGQLGDIYIDTVTGDKYKLAYISTSTTYDGVTKEYEWELISDFTPGGGSEDIEVDLSDYATKEYVDEYTGGKKQVFLNKAEYELLTDAEKNNKDVIYNIMDAENLSMPSDLIIEDDLLHLVDDDGNKIGDGVVLEISSSTNTPELILSSPSGQLYKLIVDDAGNISTELAGYQAPNLFNKECVKAGTYDAATGTITEVSRWENFVMVPVESGKSYNIKFDARARIMVVIVGEDESTVIHPNVADTGSLTTTGDYSSFSYTTPITSAAGFIRFQLAQETYTPFIMSISVMEA